MYGSVYGFYFGKSSIEAKHHGYPLVVVGSSDTDVDYKMMWRSRSEKFIYNKNDWSRMEFRVSFLELD